MPGALAPNILGRQPYAQNYLPMSNIPTFVINLDRRPDRMAEMEKRLAGIQFSRIPAVDGQSSVFQGTEKSPGALTINELACIQSHIKVLHQIIDGRAPYACILEDDVRLSVDFKSFIEDSGWIPARADLVKIETMKTKIWLDRKGCDVNGRRLHRLRSNHSGTAAYIVSRDFAARLVQRFEDPKAPADDIVFDSADYNQDDFMLQLIPALCIQDFVFAGACFDSDIESGRMARLAQSTSPIKRTLLQKCVREITRPFLQLCQLKRYVGQYRTVVSFT
jgi:glycosyl transferase family 25